MPVEERRHRSISMWAGPNALRLEINDERTLLLVDLELDVKVKAGNQKIAGDVNGANAVQHERIIERDFLRHLHHPQHDDEVSTKTMSALYPKH